VQAKMLRLLQEQIFERIGGNRSITTNVRVIAATNKNLEQLIQSGAFRNDLYYRLKVVTLPVPALRDRAEDIPSLAVHFLGRFAREIHREVRAFTPAMLERLKTYPWPGNVRELQGVVKNAILHSPGSTIGVEAWPQALGRAAAEAESSAAPFDLVERIESWLSEKEPKVYERVIAEVERELLTRALRYTRGHQAQASELLGINRTTLRTKLRELGIVLDKVVAERLDSEGAS